MVNDRSVIESAEKKLAEQSAVKPAATSAKTSQSQRVVNEFSADQKQPQIRTSSTQPVNKVNQTSNLVKPLTASLEQSIVCFESGPYTKTATAQPLYNWLKNKKVITGDIQVEIQPRQTQVLESTWVYLPPFKDRQAAYTAQQRLNKLGIVDYMIVTQGQFNNAISLGRYRNPNNVQQRLKELSTKGYQNIKTQARYKSDTRYWLNVKILQKESRSLLGAFKKHFKNLTLKQISCDLLTKAG
ncbi:MAG: SPOR domain-containing protein [Thioploca sp.]|nr:SPOR domain-containing protein [Thioploca sp.]